MNKKRFASLLVFTLTCSLSAGTLGNAAGYNTKTAAALEINNFIYMQTYEEKLKDAQDKRDKIEQDRKETENKLKELESKRDDILAYIEELDAQCMELDEKIAGYERDTAIAEENLRLTQLALEQAREDERQQYENMKKRIKYMYEHGNTGYLEVFLNANSISDILNQMEYFNKITEYDDKLLADYTLAKQEVEQQEALFELDIETLNALTAAAEEDREYLEGLIADKNERLEEYVENIGITNELLIEYADQITQADADIEAIEEEERKRIEEEERKRKEEEERIRREQQALAADLANKRLHAAEGIVQTDITDPNYMIWPLPGDGRIYAYFGYRKAPTAGASTYHQGLDIGGEYGASIVAALAGTVIEASYSASRGNYVAINHGNGIITYYMHCSKLLVSVGDYVKQGSVVALVGSTGISTGPHLHFSVKVNGTNVDPLIYVKYSE